MQLQQTQAGGHSVRKQLDTLTLALLQSYSVVVQFLRRQPVNPKRLKVKDIKINLSMIFDE